MTTPSHIVWLDLETTGLEDTDLILEVGAIVTDTDLKFKGSFHCIVGYGPGTVEARRNVADKIVVDMHDASGLWEQSIDSPHRISEALAGLTGFIDDHGAKGSPMGGSGVHFDRMMLKAWGPDVLDHFHYRNVDVSPLRTMVRLWAPQHAWKPPAELKHRALDDLDRSIAEAGHYRAVLNPKVSIVPDPQMTLGGDL